MTYCYDSFLTGKSPGGIGLGNPRGLIIMTMPTDSSLRIEKQGSEGARCDGATTNTFTANATVFDR
ncbi:MAG: hypothetical protein Q8O86_02755 [Dehalococcoidia bacterium]|nr:hypothetical protein [Dehalococcoidia bacterium]